MKKLFSTIVLASLLASLLWGGLPLPSVSAANTTFAGLPNTNLAYDFPSLAELNTSVLAGTSCFATHNNGATVFSSTDSQAVRDAVNAASAGGTVKIAGTCAGISVVGGLTQTVGITKTLTLAGGYSASNWATASPSSQPTTLDALGAGRVISATANLTLQDLTVQNGKWIVSGENGGGIFTTQAITLSNVTVYSNTVANLGGGFYATGNATLINGSIENNQSDSFGGGFWANANLTLTGTQVLNNKVNTVAAAGGGVVFGSANLTGGLFQGNISQGGTGGLYANGGANINGTRFINNVALAGGAGALYLPNANSQVVNALFANNSARDSGSVMQIPTTGQVEIIHTTIVSSTVAGTAAINISNGTTYITNTIISNYPIAVERIGGTVSENYNLFFGNTSNLSGTITSGGNSITGTTGFAETVNYTLSSASAAIDKGTNASTVTPDAFGITRPSDGNGDGSAIADIGWAEFVPSSSSCAPENKLVSSTATNGNAFYINCFFGHIHVNTYGNHYTGDVKMTSNGAQVCIEVPAGFEAIGPTCFTDKDGGRKDFYIKPKAATQNASNVAINGVTVGASGGVFGVSPWSFTVPPNVLSNGSTFALNFFTGSAPTAPNGLRLFFRVLNAQIFNGAGNEIKSFNPPLQLCYTFTDAELQTAGNANNFVILTSSDGKTWEQLQTTVDLANKKVCASVTHFSLFELAARTPTAIPITGNAALPQWLLLLGFLGGLAVGWLIIKRKTS